MFFLYISILLPVAIAVGIPQEEYVKGLSHSFKNILQGQTKQCYHFTFKRTIGFNLNNDINLTPLLFSSKNTYKVNASELNLFYLLLHILQQVDPTIEVFWVLLASFEKFFKLAGKLWLGGL